MGAIDTTIGPGHPDWKPGHPAYEARVVAGAMEPIHADRLMNIDSIVGGSLIDPGARAAAHSVSAAGGAACRVALDVPGVGRVLVDAETGAPMPDAIARAVAAADRILADEGFAKFMNAEAAALMGPGALDAYALALTVKHFAGGGC